MALFLSTYINKLDKKGRLSVPAPFRSTLSGDSFAGVVLFCSPKYTCLEGFDMQSMEDLASRVDRFDMFSSEQDDMAASIFGAAKPLSLDGQGRIILPDDLISYASLEEQVAIVGLGRKFQIWNPSALNERQAAARKNVEAQGLTLPGRMDGRMDAEGKDG